MYVYKLNVYTIKMLKYTKTNAHVVFSRKRKELSWIT